MYYLYCLPVCFNKKNEFQFEGSLLSGFQVLPCRSLCASITSHVRLWRIVGDRTGCERPMEIQPGVGTMEQSSSKSWIYFITFIGLINKGIVLFGYDQATMNGSVRLSICPSVHLSVTPFWLCSHHCIIMKFSVVITNDRGDVHAKVQGQRSTVTEVKTQLSSFRIITLVWINIWW